MTSTLRNILVACSAIFLLANCAPDHTYLVYTNPSTSGFDPAKVVVGPGVFPRSSYYGAGSVTETLPYAIDFDNLSYRLDLVKGSLSDYSTRQIIRMLTDDELNQLKSLFAGAVLASSSQENPNGCSQTLNTNYASLETDAGLYDLGYGATPCAVVDLYNSNGQLAGLQAFLNGLVSN